MLQRLEQKLLRRKELGSLRTIDLAPLAHTDSHKHRERADFSSNDYLGLARSRPLFRRVEEDYARYVLAAAPSEPILGATGSRLLTGNTELHHETERLIADFHKQPVALLANSGWDLNFGMLSSIVDADTLVLYDELSHNSLLMGIRAARKAGAQSFRHNDMEALRVQLQESRDHPSKLVVVEGVYSMDGDVAPIEAVLDLAAEFGAHVLVDEAHSTGVLGARGEGLVVSQGLQGHSALLGCVHTFGKALGQHGAALVTPHASLKQYLVNYCSPLIYSTAIPISSLVGIQASYAFCADSSAEREQLQGLIALFRKQAAQLELPALDSNTAIQGVLVPGNAAVLEAAKQLQNLGLGCLPIRAPTVVAGTERLRVVLHSHNTEQQVEQLCSSIARILQNNASHV